MITVTIIALPSIPNSLSLGLWRLQAAAPTSPSLSDPTEQILHSTASRAERRAHRQATTWLIACSSGVGEWPSQRANLPLQR